MQNKRFVDRYINIFLQTIESTVLKVEQAYSKNIDSDDLTKGLFRITDHYWAWSLQSKKKSIIEAEQTYLHDKNLGSLTRSLLHVKDWMKKAPDRIKDSQLYRGVESKYSDLWDTHLQGFE